MFPPPNDRFPASSPAAITEPGTCRFHEFCKIPAEDQTPAKVRTPRQERMPTHRKAN